MLDLAGGTRCCFLTLRDTDLDMSMSVTLPAGSVMRLGDRLADGAHVVVHARPHVPAEEAAAGFAADRRAPRRARRAARAHRAPQGACSPAEGLFDESRKRPLPFLPAVVGLVCAQQGDAEHDVVVQRAGAVARGAVRDPPGDGPGPARGARGERRDRRPRRDPAGRGHRRGARRRVVRGPAAVQQRDARARGGRVPHAARQRDRAPHSTRRCSTSSPTCAPRRRPTRPSGSCPTSPRSVRGSRRRGSGPAAAVTAPPGARAGRARRTGAAARCSRGRRRSSTRTSRGVHRAARLRGRALPTRRSRPRRRRPRPGGAGAGAVARRDARARVRGRAARGRRGGARPGRRATGRPLRVRVSRGELGVQVTERLRRRPPGRGAATRHGGAGGDAQRAERADLLVDCPTWHPHGRRPQRRTRTSRPGDARLRAGARRARRASSRRLESRRGALEESLALWERGEALAARCQEWLDGARERLAAARRTRRERRSPAGDDAAGRRP